MFFNIFLFCFYSEILRGEGLFKKERGGGVFEVGGWYPNAYDDLQRKDQNVEMRYNNNYNTVY